MLTSYCSFTYRVISISYGENSIAGVVFFQEVQHQDVIHIYGTCVEYTRIDGCADVKVAYIWFTVIKKLSYHHVDSQEIRLLTQCQYLSRSRHGWNYHKGAGKLEEIFSPKNMKTYKTTNNGPLKKRVFTREIK